MDEIELKVKKIIAEQLGIKEETSRTNLPFIEDLGADSLTTVEMSLALEDAFGIEIPDTEQGKPPHGSAGYRLRQGCRQQVMSDGRRPALSGCAAPEAKPVPRRIGMQWDSAESHCRIRECQDHGISLIRRTYQRHRRHRALCSETILREPDGSFVFLFQQGRFQHDSSCGSHRPWDGFSPRQ